MFGKRELVDNLNRDLARARNERDTLASGVTRLTARIGELEIRLSAENERLEREKAAGEILQIKKVVRDRSSAFSAAIAGLRNATEAAETIVPEIRELTESLDVTATKVARAIDGLLSELDLRIETVRAGNAAPELPESLTRSAETPQISSRVLRLQKPTKEAAEAHSRAIPA
jgi:chromosome segregation ATPase